MKLVFEADLSRPDALKQFHFPDPAVWRMGSFDGKPVLEQFRDYRQTTYKPPHRSPFTYCLLAAPAVGDFVLEVEGQNTHADAPHRDVVFVWGWQSATKFYYAHVATKADAVAHTMLVVDEAPRVKLPTAAGSQGADWGRDVWRTVRVTRTFADGKMSVYFEDMAKPVLTATDKRFGVGRVGFGTFDDTCRVRAVRLWASDTADRLAPVFPRGG
jgi:hypothetical protein